MSALQHQYLVIEGNIGAGKTTLSNMLSQQFNTRLILEEFAENPFLPFFYENPERYAFPVELFFMTERHKQLQEQLQQGSLFQNAVVSDYFFVKTQLFAKNNLGEEEFRLFQRLFHVLNSNVPKPDLLVYLHRNVDDLLVNIQNRGRAYEAEIQAEYLLNIQHAYLEYFRSVEQIPILILDVTGISFWENQKDYERIVAAINTSYPLGINRIRL